MKLALIIFVRNPELGRVKTRLAETIGDEAALSIYKELLQHTHAVVSKVDSDRFIFYTDSINNDDLWTNNMFKKYLQSDGDLGEKMKNAFETIFSLGYEKVLIIGSDCYDLTPEIVSDAFKALGSSDVVIGPSIDGGYYLLGMKKLLPYLFDNIEWSTASVCADTVKSIESNNERYSMLKVLSDIDEESDLPEPLQAFVKQIN